jgi:hypothetical protein
MKALLFSLTILLLLFINLGNIYAQQGNFVLLYNFDQGKGDTVKDLSGKGNDGKITDSAWNPDGKFNGGMEFNGKTSFIEVPHSDSLNIGGDKLTIMAWVNPISFPTGYPTIARKGAVADACWGLDTPSGKLRGFVYVKGSAIIAEGIGIMELKKWNHAAMVYDGKDIRIYLNGKLDMSIKASGDIGQKDGVSVWISKKADEANFLNCVMDDFAILNIALSEAQIKSYMEGGLLKVAVEVSDKIAVSWGSIKNLN